MSKKELNNDMMKSLDKVLSEHMPEYVCGVVKDRLEAADAMEVELEETQGLLDRTKEELKKLRHLEGLQKSLEDGQEALRRLSAANAEEHREFKRDKKVYELEQQLTAQQIIAKHATEVNLALTRNMEHRKSIFRDVITPVEGGNGGCGYVDRQSVGETIIEGVD